MPGSARASWNSVSRRPWLRSAAAGCSHGTSRRSPATMSVAVDLGDLPARREVRERVAADRDDHARRDQRELLLQPRQVVGDLVGLRVAVARRPRLDDVGDEDVVARPAPPRRAARRAACPSGRRTGGPACPRSRPAPRRRASRPPSGSPLPARCWWRTRRSRNRSRSGYVSPRAGRPTTRGGLHARRHATRFRRARRGAVPGDDPRPAGIAARGRREREGDHALRRLAARRLRLPRRRAHRQGRGARSRAAAGAAARTA